MFVSNCDLSYEDVYYIITTVFITLSFMTYLFTSLHLLLPTGDIVAVDKYKH